jgi:hypothetical protein
MNINLLTAAFVICSLETTRVASMKLPTSTLCLDPPTEMLEQQLAAYQMEFYKISDHRLSYSNSLGPSRDVQESDEECDDSARFKRVIKKKSICPWKIVEVRRQDRYPFVIRQAQCTCSYCSQTLKNRRELGCLPFRQRVPVLVRGNLTDKSTGYCPWTPSSEEINVNCMCSILSNGTPID